jgi:Cell division protein ZapA.
MDEITINIMIVDRSYRLTVARADEEKVRKAATLINEKVKSYSKHYAFKDSQDLLSMTALQFATSTVKYESELTYKDQYLEQKLNELSSLLSEHLGS